MTASRAAAGFLAQAVCRILLFAASCLAAGALAQAQAQQPQPAPEARIIVTGEGSVRVAPDYARIQAGVTTKAKTAKEATDANSKLMAAITAALLNSGIEQKDIQTSRFSVQPVYAAPQPGSEAKLVGFSVSNRVSVTVRQIGMVGEILDRLITAGATDVGNIDFLHADAVKPLDQAREAAIADARRKAELYARAAGVNLGGVAWITEESGYAPPTRVGAPRMATAPSPVPISAGEDTMQVQIVVGFDIAR